MLWNEECARCEVKRDCYICKTNKHKPDNQPDNQSDNQPDIHPNSPMTSKETLILPSASDFHVHLRQDDLMNMVVPRIAEGGVSLCYVMVL
jgi:hypothetical protein